jgi:nucleotide-binding universal stress UspA family protein
MTERIVVGVDDSEGARVALRWALAEGERRHARVDVIHAYVFEIAWIDAQDIERWAAAEQRSANAALRRVLDDAPAPAGVEVTGTVAEGNPVKVLLDASRAADLLVVGSRGRGGIAGLLLGSVSQRCVERAVCPVVVVRSVQA